MLIFADSCSAKILAVTPAQRQSFLPICDVINFKLSLRQQFTAGKLLNKLQFLPVSDFLGSHCVFASLRCGPLRNFPDRIRGREGGGAGGFFYEPHHAKGISIGLILLLYFFAPHGRPNVG